ncbi:hypothetical protein BofuT4_uP131360.1 [Botrytis cinerea T4]|uniref:Uncharacterized protein n=1 Tax=Botryotinia fuckeliana (strain T4) TaxID=999810 RepID=G2YQQ8_BOTF4|nr:hypothetical protein BofuT4_uP131360.1 [Botrytis cinerea T4]
MIGKLTLAHLHRQLMVAPTSVCFCYQHFYDPTMGWHANYIALALCEVTFVVADGTKTNDCLE